MGPQIRSSPEPIMADECLLQHKKLLSPELHQYMNVTMSVDGEKEKAYSLRNVLEKRCPALLVDVNLIKKKKEKKGDAGVMTIDFKSGVMSIAILNRVLEWCYTDTLDFEGMNTTDLLVLLRASTHFEAPRLVYLCSVELRRRLTVDEVFFILKETTRLHMKETKTLATSFAHQNWPQFCAHKGGTEIIGIELFQEITVAMQFYKPEEKIDTTPEALKFVPSTIVNDFREILKEGRFSDADFVFKDVGESMRFHRAIVAAHSRPLFQLISANNKVKQFVLDGLSPVAVRDLLEYIYYSDADFDPLGACQMVEYAVTQFALQHMLDDCIESISDGITVDGSLPILRVTYLPNFEQNPAMRELREKALNQICRHFKNTAIPDLRGIQPPSIAYAMTADILDKVFTSFPMEGPTPSEGYSEKERRSKERTRKKRSRTSKTPREKKSSS